VNRVSVILICQDEEDRIEACLESVSWADEIVVVDSGSQDNTLELAGKYNARIFEQRDWQGFGYQKRYAEEKASNDWIFSIDADEVVSKELREAILQILQAPDERAVYRINRLTCFHGRMIRHSGWHPDRIVRLYNRKHYHFNDKVVHEKVDCNQARKVDLDGILYHYTLMSPGEYIDKRNRYAKSWAEHQHSKGRKTGVFEILVRPAFAFFRHYILRRGFLDGYPGFLIAVIQMQYTFNKYNFLKFLNDHPDPHCRNKGLPKQS